MCATVQVNSVRCRCCPHTQRVVKLPTQSNLLWCIFIRLRPMEFCVAFANETICLKLNRSHRLFWRHTHGIGADSVLLFRGASSVECDTDRRQRWQQVRWFMTINILAHNESGREGDVVCSRKSHSPPVDLSSMMVYAIQIEGDLLHRSSLPNFTNPENNVWGHRRETCTWRPDRCPSKTSESGKQIFRIYRWLISAEKHVVLGLWKAISN